LADAVALRHLRWIRRNLGPGERDSVAVVASAWNLGLEGYFKHGANKYGRRVAAVYRHVKTPRKLDS
jgi:hypothetical protein